MKQLLRHITARSVRKAENTHLRRENARLRDELAAARAEIGRHKASIDDLLDMTGAYALAPELERLSTGRVYPWEHHHDDRELTVDQAHAVMRRHLGCLTDSCRVRRAAVRVLREARHMVADPGRPGAVEPAAVTALAELD